MGYGSSCGGPELKQLAHRQAVAQERRMEARMKRRDGLKDNGLPIPPICLDCHLEFEFGNECPDCETWLVETTFRSAEGALSTAEGGQLTYSDASRVRVKK